MSTVQLLVYELNSLVSQSKRRNVELKQASEKSLELLKSYSPGSDEKVFFQSLSTKSSFILPLLIACNSRNAKYCATAIQCLQSLINLEGLPTDQLPEVLDALKEATNLGVEIQLKILQTLTPLIQVYKQFMYDDLLSNLLLVCSILQNSNKVSVVTNTASATFQQIIISIFDKVAKEDREATENVSTAKTFQVSVDRGEKVYISPAAYDTMRLLLDLCNLTERQKPEFLKFSQLPETFGLELFESILTNHSELFLKHVELAFVLRTRVAPLLLRAFAEKRNFPVTVRVGRVLYLLIRRELPVLKVECEVILSLVTHVLDVSSSPYWKRLLCMEVFQGTCLEFILVKDIYHEYDSSDNRRDAIFDMLTAFEKIVNENPEIIGTGNFSRKFAIPDSFATTESDPIRSAQLEKVPGISVATSSSRVPCIDLLDKMDPPKFSNSYIYFLVLTCINSLSDGLARIVISTSSQGDSGPKTLNNSRSDSALDLTKSASPLERSFSSRSRSSNEKEAEEEEPERVDMVETATSFVEKCWKIMLAMYTKFFFATMDQELYHSLVRSTQRFAQAAGVLGLEEPRYEFIALLARFTLLVESPSNNPSSSNGDPASGVSRAPSILSVEGIVGTLSASAQRSVSGITGSPVRGSVATPGSSSRANFTTFNVLCARALMNTGIMLGSQLGTSWGILIEVLQYIDVLLHGSGRRKTRASIKGTQLFKQLGNEFLTLDASLSKLLQSTSDYSKSSFRDLIKSICSISAQTLGLEFSDKISPSPALEGISDLQEGDRLFLLDVLGDIIQINITRFVRSADSDNWTYFVDYLIQVITSQSVNSDVKHRAASVFNEAALQACVESCTGPSIDSATQRRFIESIEHVVKEIANCYSTAEDESWIFQSTMLDIHISITSNLNKILDQFGNKLDDGWDTVLNLIDSVFYHDRPLQQTQVKQSSRLVRSGFESLQLICNDFLSSLPQSCLRKFIDTLYQFCIQEKDLNISFTAISFFWTVSDHLRGLLNEKDMPVAVETEQELMQQQESDHSSMSVHCLWLILLLCLARIANNVRGEVRNGAVQILFRIFEAHGNNLTRNIWMSSQKVVFPSIMNVELAQRATIEPKESRESINETVMLILSGISNIYATFMYMFVSQENFDQVWHCLLDYYQRIIEITDKSGFCLAASVYKGIDVVFKSFMNEEKKISIPSSSLDAAWKFWTSQVVPEFNPSQHDPKIIQEAVTVLIELHKPLYSLSKANNMVTEENNEKSIQLLKKAGSFPVLPSYYSDRDHMSPLQSSAMSIIESIDIDSLHSSAIVLGLLADLILLPFTVKSSDEPPTAYKIPTFISIGYNALQLLCNDTDRIQYYSELTESKTINHVLASLLVPMEHKFSCPLMFYNENMTKKSGNQLELWQLATVAFLEIVNKLSVVLENGDNSHLWELILRGALSILNSTKSSKLQNDCDYEQFDVDSHKKLMQYLDTHYEHNRIPLEFWKKIVAELFDCSFLYFADNDNSVPLVGDSLLKFMTGPVYGSTEIPELLPRAKLAYLCIHELSSLFERPGDASPIAGEWLIWRCVIVLMKYISDRPLRGSMPMPIVQRLELECLLTILQKHAKTQKGSVGVLYPLIARAVPIAANDVKTLARLQRLMIDLK